MADSFHCAVEINTTLWSNYTIIKTSSNLKVCFSLLIELLFSIHFLLTNWMYPYFSAVYWILFFMLQEVLNGRNNWGSRHWHCKQCFHLFGKIPPHPNKKGTGETRKLWESPVEDFAIPSVILFPISKSFESYLQKWLHQLLTSILISSMQSLFFFLYNILESSNQSPCQNSFHSFSMQKTEYPFWNTVFLCIKSLNRLSLYLARNPTRTRSYSLSLKFYFRHTSKNIMTSIWRDFWDSGWGTSQGTLKNHSH